MADSVIHTSGARLFNAAIPFLIVLIFAGTFGSFFYFVIQPELQKYLPGGPVNVETVKTLLGSRQTYRDDLKNLADFYKATIANKQDPLMMVLPSKEDIPTLYATFEKIAQDASVSLQSIEIIKQGEDAKNTKGQIRTVSIAVRFGGLDYEGLKRLIDILELNMRLTHITSVQFDPQNHSASFSVETYYFADRSPQK